MISIIVAIADNGVIGGDNQLLWHISEDLRHFKEITSGHPVVMGRKCYESIGRPLPNRENIVMTRSDVEIEGCRMAHSLEEALAGYSPAEEVFIIGGAEIYKEALPLADRLYITRVHADYEGDVIFPEYDNTEWRYVDSTWHARGEKFEHPYTFVEYRRVACSDAPYYISQVTARDLSAIREVAITSFEPTYINIVSLQQIEFMTEWMYSFESLKQQFADGHQFYLLHHDGRAMGYLSLEPQGENLVHLQRLYIDPTMHGKGYGRKLIEHGFVETKRLCGGRPCRVELNVNRENKATDFYFRIGMEIERQGDYEIPDTKYLRTDYILYKDL